MDSLNNIIYWTRYSLIEREKNKNKLDTNKTRRVQQPKSLFSPREQECLKFIRKGYSRDDIAKKLGISIRTVDTYIMSARKKTGLKHRNELITCYLSVVQKDENEWDYE